MTPLVPPHLGRVTPDPFKAAWLASMILGALIGLPSVTPRLFAISATIAAVTLCLGHSVGLHRGIIHATYRCPRWVRGALAYLFVHTGLGGPLSWARLHAVRDHWQNQRDCPRYFAYDHGLGTDLVWTQWLRFEPADDRALARLPPDVLGDRWLRFLEWSWPLHVLGAALVALALLGPDGVAVCVSSRVAVGILMHAYVGYAAHAPGARPFPIAGASESGTNLPVLGVLSFGEGFHNNHHAFPRSARMGLGRWELDAGWAAIRVLAACGLVEEVTAAELRPSDYTQGGWPPVSGGSCGAAAALHASRGRSAPSVPPPGR
jgi:stearoyl-CoA desaturase (delta-9 desaturase)